MLMHKWNRSVHKQNNSVNLGKYKNSFSVVPMCSTDTQLPIKSERNKRTNCCDEGGWILVVHINSHKVFICAL